MVRDFPQPTCRVIVMFTGIKERISPSEVSSKNRSSAGETVFNIRKSREKGL